jgi:hypothetical protein
MQPMLQPLPAFIHSKQLAQPDKDEISRFFYLYAENMSSSEFDFTCAGTKTERKSPIEIEIEPPKTTRFAQSAVPLFALFCGASQAA